MSSDHAEKTATHSSQTGNDGNSRTVDRTGKGGSACRPASPLPISDDDFPPSRPRRRCPDCQEIAENTGRIAIDRAIRFVVNDKVEVEGREFRMVPPIDHQYPQAGARGADWLRNEHTEHIKERLTGGAPGVDRLLRRLKRHALFFQLVHDILKIFHRARQAIDAGYDHCVAFPDAFQQNLQFRASIPTSARPFLFENRHATRFLKGSMLDG
jgi:hypothetical protein